MIVERESEPKSPMKIMMDTCVMRLTKLKESFVVDSPAVVGGITLHNRVVGVRDRRIRPGLNSDSIEPLKVITNKARSHDLVLCSSMELMSEQMQHPDGFPFEGNLLAGVRLEYVPEPINADHFYSLSSNAFIQTDRRIDFCKRLLPYANRTDEFPRRGMGGYLSPYELESVENLGRFSELCKGLPEHFLPDVWHLWTAERANIDYFLTVDAKFIRVMTLTSRAALRTIPLTPKELVDKLGLGC